MTPPGLNLVRAGPRRGAPVVFLHAVGLDLTWWDAQFAAFAPQRDLVAFDLPGHSRSTPLDLPLSLERLAATLGTLLDHLGTPAHLVGLSVGGMIAQTLATRRPETVRSLTLVGTLCTFPDPVRAALRDRAHMAREQGMSAIAPLTQERWFPAAFRTRRPDILDRAAKSLLAHDPAVHGAMWDAIAALDLSAALPSLRCPALVVNGAEDPNAPPAAGQQIASLIPAAEFHALEGVGHLPPVELPDAFNALLRQFLDRIDPA